MRIGVDVGGTFTDLVALDGEHVRVVKVPTTIDQSEGFRDALGRAGGSPSEVLHGTTVATNAVLERRGARLGFIATSGFRHILHLARQDRPSLYDLRAVRPEPLAATDRCAAVDERVGPGGDVITALDEASVRSALEALRDCEALCVTLLHSYARPEHEQRVASIAAEMLPGVPVSISSDVLREFREYERASTAALNAYVAPVAGGYLTRLSGVLRDTTLAVMSSGGGLASVDEASRLPVHLLLSGPAAGVLGASWAARAAGFVDLVTFDMGGTSTDVCIVDAGVPEVAEESSLDGLPFRTPCLDVVSVGAGGGSVAWVDEGGALRVGPRSAGAAPGPACYARGGTDATVTDAHVLLGHLGPGGLAGGELTLDAGAASQAIARVAAQANLSPDDAADGILRVVRATMARAIRSVSIERGKDVRDYVLVAFGGAGPLHAVALARELGMRTVVVPPAPGALAALGLLVAPRRVDLSRTMPMAADSSNDGLLAKVLGELEDGARTRLTRDGVTVAEVRSSADCRYAGQSYELRVDARGGFAAARAIFDEAHRARYGFDRRDAPVEAVTLRVAAFGPEPGVRLPPPPSSGRVAPVGERMVAGVRVPVFDRGELPSGATVRGPAVVTELDATMWLDKAAVARVHPSGALVVTL